VRSGSPAPRSPNAGSRLIRGTTTGRPVVNTWRAIAPAGMPFCQARSRPAPTDAATSIGSWSVADSATAPRTASCDRSRISSTFCSAERKFVALPSAWLTSSREVSLRISPLCGGDAILDA
jgi:hypothetical protein